jgi:hypothetical protein
MSYIDQTLINDYQHKVVENELRVPRYGLIDLIKAQTPLVPFNNPELQAAVLNYASGNSLKVPAMEEDTIVTSTSESFVIPANLSESAMTSLSLTTIFAGFATYPETFANNVISEEAYVLNKINEVDKAMAKKLEEYIATHLNTYKTAVWTGDDAITGHTFQEATDALEITLAAQSDVMFADIVAQAARNDWSEDQLMMAMNPSGQHVLNQYMKYGSTNEKNLQWQGMPDIYKSNRVTVDAGKRWTGYLLEPGAIGLLVNLKPAFRQRVTVGEAKWDVSDSALPQLGHQVMLYENKEKVNATGVGSYADHAIMSWKKEYGFIFRFALLKRYNSDTDSRAGYILKINGETA